jgi:hypothetical protein
MAGARGGFTDYTTVWITEEGRADFGKGSFGGRSPGSVGDFQDGLSNRRRYPVEQFRAFWDAGKRYAELTKNDPLIHRKVVAAINGLREFLEVERKRIPGTIIADADRLESLLFSGYDPYFEGDEPPGL